MRFICLFMLIAFTLHARADELLVGTVLDKETKQPVPYVSVRFSTINNEVFQSNTNKEGVFKVLIDKSLSYKIMLSKEGYFSKTIAIDNLEELKRSEPPYYGIYLAPKIKPQTPTTKAKISSNSVVKTGTGSFSYENTVSERSFKTSLPDSVEDIGVLDSLPKGYRIIEAKPIKEQKQYSTGFNVNVNKGKAEATVNTTRVKELYNKKLSYGKFDNKSLGINKGSISWFRNGSIYYAPMRSNLSEEVKQNIDQILDVMKMDTARKLQVVVYCDSNIEQENAELITQQRAEKFVNYALNQAISFEQLKVRLIGNSKLVNGCYKNVECTNEEHQENRRVDLIFTNPNNN